MSIGKISLFRNDKKPAGSKQPDYRGGFTIDGSEHEFSMWLNEYGGFSLSFKPKEAREKPQTPHNEAKADAYQPPLDDQEIPF